MLATCRVGNGLYVLEHSHKALVDQQNSNRLHASYEVLHNHLGHMSFSIISLLHKLGYWFITSLLPKPGILSSKSHKLPFSINDK